MDKLLSYIDQWIKIAPLLALCITALGWFFVNRNQRRLYQMQISVPRTIKQIEEFISWINDGHKLHIRYIAMKIENILSEIEEDNESVGFSKEKLKEYSESRFNWALDQRYYLGMTYLWDKQYKKELFEKLTSFITLTGELIQDLEDFADQSKKRNAKLFQKSVLTKTEKQFDIYQKIIFLAEVYIKAAIKHDPSSW
jgi:hypothetical protein